MDRVLPWQRHSESDDDGLKRKTSWLGVGFRLPIPRGQGSPRVVTSVRTASIAISTRSANSIRQRTIAREATVRGIGFVTGVDVELRFKPADADTGLLFVRTDLPNQPHIPADIAYVAPRRLRTTLESGAAKVEMTEHVLAALSGLGIHNCIIEIDGPEAPGMDGSAKAFADALCNAGILVLGVPAPVLEITETVTVAENEATVTIEPTEHPGLVVEYCLDYGNDLALGRQLVSFPVDGKTFCRELAPARTFILERDIAALRSQGLGKGVSFSDLLVLNQAGQPIDNEFRYPDECARHKALDVIGDLALLGMPIKGHVRATKSGHWLNAALVRELESRYLPSRKQQTKAA